MKKPKLRKYPTGGTTPVPAKKTVIKDNKEFVDTLSKYKKINQSVGVPAPIASYVKDSLRPELVESNAYLDAALRKKYKLSPTDVINGKMILTKHEGLKVLGANKYKTYTDKKSAYSAYRDKTDWEKRNPETKVFTPQIGPSEDLTPAYDSVSSTMFNTPYVTNLKKKAYGGVQKFYNGGMSMEVPEDPGLAPLRKPNATVSTKAEANRNGVAAIAGSINPVVGGIIGGVNAIAKPIKNNAEKMDSQGNLMNQNKAQAGAIAGNFLSPSTLVSTIADGKWDLTGKKYANSLEAEAKAKIDEERAPMLAAEEAKRNMYYTYAQGGIHSPYTDPGVLKYNRTIEDINPNFNPINLNQIPNYVDPNLLHYNKTIEPLKYKRSIEPLKFKRTIQDLPQGHYEEYANGGLIYDNPNAAIEKKEVVRYPDGSTAQANHGTHESGNDAEINLPNGTQIFSDRLKDPSTKKTFAKMAERYKTNKEQKIIDNPKADKTAKSTAQLIADIKHKKLDALFQTQEQLKQAKLNKYAEKLGLSNEFRNGGTKLPKFNVNKKFKYIDPNNLKLTQQAQQAEDYDPYTKPLLDQQFNDAMSNMKSSNNMKGNTDWIEPATNTLLQNSGNIMDLAMSRMGTKYDKENYGQVNPNLYDPREALRQADIEARVTRDRLKDASGGNAGALMSNLQQSQAINTMNKSKIRTDASNMNNQVLNDFAWRNKDLNLREISDTKQNKARSEDIARQAVRGIGTNTSAAYRDYKAGKMDQNTAKMISSMFANYKLDMNNPQHFEWVFKTVNQGK